MEINVKSQEFLKALRQMQEKFPETSKRIAIEFAEKARKYGIGGIIPRRTHNLASTARVEVTEGSVKFITGGIMGKGSPAKMVDYASYVEKGTSRQAPQFFMIRSVNAASGDLDSIANKTLKSWLNYMK